MILGDMLSFDGSSIAIWAFGLIKKTYVRPGQISFSIIWILDIFVSKIKEEIVRPMFIPTRYLCVHGLTTAYCIFHKELDYKLHYESLSPATALESCSFGYQS